MQESTDSCIEPHHRPVREGSNDRLDRRFIIEVAAPYAIVCSDTNQSELYAASNDRTYSTLFGVGNCLRG
jgi:hypothetical protein